MGIGFLRTSDDDEIKLCGYVLNHCLEIEIVMRGQGNWSGIKRSYVFEFWARFKEEIHPLYIFFQSSNWSRYTMLASSDDILVSGPGPPPPPQNKNSEVMRHFWYPWRSMHQKIHCGCTSWTRKMYSVWPIGSAPLARPTPPYYFRKVPCSNRISNAKLKLLLHNAQLHYLSRTI
jgi:hypothetical protein